MESDIKKIIEEEDIQKWLLEKGLHNLVISTRFDKDSVYVSDAISMYLQHANRWRKASVCRPEVDSHLMYSCSCLVKLESGCLSVAVYHSCGAWMESGTEEYLDTVIEWKPIS